MWNLWASLCVAQTLRVEPASDLDFWVGKWDVYAEGRLDGTDEVVKDVGGFAFVENWKDVTGGVGKSLFYYLPAETRWKQVWVTDQGVYKEKLSEPYEGGIRFVGKVFLPDGRTFDDRTTLTRQPAGEVRQVIEISRDGKTWKILYDANYRPKKG